MALFQPDKGGGGHSRLIWDTAEAQRPVGPVIVGGGVCGDVPECRTDNTDIELTDRYQSVDWYSELVCRDVPECRTGGDDRH